jgi:murein peptide amidase A
VRTPRTLLAIVVCGWVAALAAGCGAAPRPSAQRTGARAASPVRHRFVIGRSSAGRPLRAVEVGNPAASRKLLVVGCVHGNEPAGIAIAQALARGPAPPRAALLVVELLNPDGQAANTRQNGRGVDLNRNFSFDWHPGVPGDTFYPGPSPFSEPESRAIAALIRRERPAVSIWFHQHMNVVDLSGGDRRIETRFARLTGMSTAQLIRPPGSAVRWQNHSFPGTTSFVVELHAGALSAPEIARFAHAVRVIAEGAPAGA